MTVAPKYRRVLLKVSGEALMGDQQLWRSDVSMTLFLNNPDDYDGGELAMPGPA